MGGGGCVPDGRWACVRWEVGVSDVRWVCTF